MKKKMAACDYEQFYAKFYLLFRQIVEMTSLTVKQPFIEFGHHLVTMCEQLWQNFILFHKTNKVGYLLKSQAMLETISIQLKLLLDEKQISSGHHLILITLISDLREIYNSYV